MLKNDKTAFVFFNRMRINKNFLCTAVYVRSTTFGRGKKGADNKGATKRAQNKKGAGKKGAEQKGRRAKRAQNKKGARSRCCVTVTFKVVISSDNRVLSQSFFFFFICRNIIHSLRLHCLKYGSIKGFKTEESYNTKL